MEQVQDPYKFYNNRFLRRNEEPLSIHSDGKKNGQKWREGRSVKLYPLVSESGSDGRYSVSENMTGGDNQDKSKSNTGYLPAQLNVQDLLPGKQDGGNKLTTTGDVVIVTARDSSVLGEMKVNVAAQFNPYNKFNQKFHSSLWCPVCTFLFFVFCMPAVMYMRESDKAFANQDFKKAKKYGTLSTFLYVSGVLFGLVFYAFIIFVAIYFSKRYCGAIERDSEQ